MKLTKKNLISGSIRYILSIILICFAIFISVDGIKAVRAPICSVVSTDDCYPFGAEGSSGEFPFLESKEKYVASILAANLLVLLALYFLIFRRSKQCSLSILLWFGLTILVVSPKELIGAPASYELSIVDLILDVPSDLINIRADKPDRTFKKSELKSSLKSIDIKNGYAEFGHADVISIFKFAEFRLKGDRRLLFITEDGESVQSIKVLKREAQGTWTNVSDRVLPKISSSFILERYKEKFPSDFEQVTKLLNTYAGTIIEYRLPQVGKRISVVSGIDMEKFYGKKLFTLELKNEHFEIIIN